MNWLVVAIPTNKRPWRGGEVPPEALGEITGHDALTVDVTNEDQSYLESVTGLPVDRVFSITEPELSRVPQLVNAVAGQEFVSGLEVNGECVETVFYIVRVKTVSSHSYA